MKIKNLIRVLRRIVPVAITNAPVIVAAGKEIAKAIKKPKDLK